LSDEGNEVIVTKVLGKDFLCEEVNVDELEFCAVISPFQKVGMFLS
jgi:hypothetical protein